MRAFVRELEDLVKMFFQGLGQVVASGLGLLFVASLFWFAWEIFARLI